ncbi:MAG: maleylacetoacetate isomerase [Nevskiales bacterium]
MKLYSYWRSSASYRVRIALALKRIAYETIPIHLVKNGGGQNSEDYRKLNPQGRVPLLVDGDFKLTQSMAILSYLESQYPQPALLPADARARARVWAFCEAINADIQPLQNSGPLGYLTREFKISEDQKTTWLRHWIERGLAALEQELAPGRDEACVFGATPTLADCLLVPQMYAAERFAAETAKFPRLKAIAEQLRLRPEFIAAHPDRQPDANT